MDGVDGKRQRRGLLRGAAGRARPALLLLVALLIGAFVVINQSSVHWRENVADSHYYAYCGWRVLAGARPYLDVWNNKPPGTWWINALGCWLCGEGVLREIVICSAALAGALAAFAGTACLSYGRGMLLPATLAGGVLLADVRFEGGANRTEPFVVLFETLAILAYLRWLRSDRLVWLIVAGGAVGAAPLFKQSGLGAAGACAAHLLGTQVLARIRARAANQRRSIGLPWLAAGGGAIIAPLLAAGALAVDGALGEAWFAVATFNRTYFAAHDATWVRLPGALQTYWPSVKPLGGMFIVAGIGLVWALSARRRARHAAGQTGPSRTFVELYWLWFLLAAYLACVGPGRRAYHLLPALAPLGLLCLHPLHLLAQPGGLSARLTRRAATVLAFVLWVYALSGVWLGNLHEVARYWQAKPHWYSPSYTEATGYQLRAAEIRRRSRPDEEIYVWGWTPGTYRFAYRHCVSRFATLEKLGQVGSRARFILEEALRDIRRTPPKIFVISRDDLAAMMAEPRDDFAVWLAARYEKPGALIDGMYLLERKDNGP